MLKAGELRSRVFFLKTTKVEGNYGDKEAFIPFKNTKCKFTQIATAGRIVDDQEITENRYLIKLRKRTDITEDMRMTISGVEIQITGILQEPEPRETHIYGKNIT